VDEQRKLTSLFIVAPHGKALYHRYHEVILVDSTYRTNQYRLPLLQIVGASESNISFVIAVAFITSETVDAFVWALNCLKRLVFPNGPYPKVVTTDMDDALREQLRWFSLIRKG